MLKSLLLVLALLVPITSFANQLTPITIPSTSQLTYQGEHDGTYTFQGELKLQGILSARWGKDLTGETAKKIYLQFLPERAQLVSLPVIEDQYRASNQMITLNIKAGIAKNKEIIQATFSNIPNSFWIYQEGTLTQPVSVTVKDFHATDDCDYRYYYADIVSITAIKTVQPVIEARKGCDSYIFDSNYTIQSKDGYSNLRQQPNSKAAIIEKLPNAMMVKKLKTEGSWYYVNILKDNKPTKTNGYLHKSQVIEVD